MQGTSGRTPRHMPTNSADPSREPPFRAGNLIRLLDVCRFLGISRSTVYKRLSERSFPVPARLGPRTVRWRVDDIEAWRDAHSASQTN
jgi:prophage regulatory protein